MPGEEIKIAEAIVDAVQEVSEQAEESVKEVVNEALDDAAYATRLDEVDKKIEEFSGLPARIDALDASTATLITSVEEIRKLTDEATTKLAELADKVVAQPVAEVTRAAMEPVTNPSAVVDTIKDGGQEVTSVAETLPKRTHALTKRWFTRN